jgi:hypothetical protein|nr:MAG: hypothetical protein DIU57_11845 [Pseudomonadota bacterium]
MTGPTQAFLDHLKAAATSAHEAENSLRKRMAEEIARLERQRAFAYRRLNLMNEVAKAVASAENEEAAVARGLAVLRSELGWTTETETRKATLERFERVARATFAGLSPNEGAETAPDLADELSGFETWYEATYGKPFWVLFDQEIQEIPLVEPS